MKVLALRVRSALASRPGLEWVGVAILTGAALLLRLYRLGSQGLWFDKAYTLFIARIPAVEAWRALVVDGVHPPLFYALQKAALALGQSEFALRLPSAVFGAAAVPLVYILGRRWAGWGTGALAALLLALSPFHLWTSQDARMYSLLAALTLACMLTFDGVLRRPGLATGAAFVALSALAYLTHYFALMLPLVQLVYLAAKLRTWPRLLRLWTGLQFLAGLPLLGWVYALSLRDMQIFGIGWIPVPHPTDLIETLLNFTVGYTAPLRLWQWLGLGICMVFLILGLRSRWGVPSAKLLVALWAFLPMVLTFLLSLRRPVYIDRFLILSAPALLILIAAGVASLRERYALVSAALLVALLGFSAIRFCFQPGQAKEQWREAAAYLSRAAPDEAIIVRVLQIVVPLSIYYDGPLPQEAMEVNRVFTPLEELAVGHRGTGSVYWNASLDAHRVAGNPPFDPAAEQDPVAAAWLAGQQPPLLERADFEGVTVFHFRSLP
ncbi:MAG: glycosyltransferase family 39 protein [Dehalococcoidia bacterium]|nr:glycosyltransferase family 39 protein [Dehalococcoidia bacterium]